MVTPRRARSDAAPGRIVWDHFTQWGQGKIAMAKELDEKAVRLAVVAHVRHAETDYDLLLLAGVDRGEARQRVEDRVSRVLETWEHGR